MIYCDSSALLKLVFLERETTDLRRWLLDRPDVTLTGSEVARVEVLRGCRRINAGALPQARTLVDSMLLIPLSTSVVEKAADLSDPPLRSLDALHLASALSIADELTAFVAYDRRLSSAATVAGLDVVRPGR